MSGTPEIRTIAVLGAGAWGLALANVAARAGRDVILWARDAAHVAQMRDTRESPRLPGVKLEARARPEESLARAVEADLVLAAVPAQATDELAKGLAPLLAPGVPVTLCSKGIEATTGRFMSDILAASLPNNPPAILSGPSFAADVSRGLPTAVTLAAGDEDLARRVAAALSAPGFRLYHSTDIRGVEIGGAAKNVLAIACGIAEGRGLGASAVAALVARGFAELRRFGAAYGARPETLMGLSGLGDLVLTCGSARSRNFAYGLALGRGEPPATAAHGKLAEGVATASILVKMALARQVDMPICAAVEAILAGRVDVDGAAEALLARPSKSEE